MALQDPPSFSAPHQADQGDVYAGHNASFMGVGNLPMPSKHMAAEDMCVGCHMAPIERAIAPPIERLARRHLDPALADAVLLDIRALLVIEANADLVFEHGCLVMRTPRIDRQVIRQRRPFCNPGYKSTGWSLVVTR